MEEVWKPVVGYEGAYSVSNFGRVRNEARMVATGGGLRRVRERVLKRGFDRKGYPQVSLCVDGKARVTPVHRIVTDAFKGPCPEGLERRHLDGDPSNCRSDNIVFGTRKENHADKLIHGTDNRGEKNPLSKLTRDQVLKIREDRRWQQYIAAEYGVSQTMVSRIKLRKAWAHL